MEISKEKVYEKPEISVIDIEEHSILTASKESVSADAEDVTDVDGNWGSSIETK